ncbi:MAG: fumarylacetoacetate hydrolase family protein [Acidobacteriia bacterium]|nr:fumarylacetoacetate hydrolase family protein [Terriglobia bacterium]
MASNRRTFLKGAGVVGAMAATSGLTMGNAQNEPARKSARGMAKNLTVLHIFGNGERRLGVKTEKGILDVAAAAGILKMHAPATVDDLLQNEDGPSLNALVDAAAKSNKVAKAYLPESGIEYGPLVTRPEKIVCIGHNYKRHVEEVKAPWPKQPVVFSKYNSALNWHLGKIKLPVDVAKNFDYEIELVIVMGKTASNVAEADALSYVAGYATGNDFTARDLQYERGGQWLIGKTPDGFAPVGPYMVTADQIDPQNLKLECRVNGETRQSWNTNDMIFPCKQLIGYVSKHMTLKPGDIIYTGTPQGVIYGMPPDKRVWLKPGDKIACSLEKLGELKFELV